MTDFVFKKQKHLNILYLIQHFQMNDIRITMPHFKKYLIDEYQLGIKERKNLPTPPASTDFIEKQLKNIEKAFRKKELTKEGYALLKNKILSDDLTTRLKYNSVFDNNVKFKDAEQIRRHLQTLKRLGYVIEHPPKKGKNKYPSYTLSEKASIELTRIILKKTIDDIQIPVNLFKVQAFVLILHFVEKLSKEPQKDFK